MAALGARIGAYVKLTLSQTSLAQAVFSGIPANIESRAVAELKILREADPVVSTFEITDDKGIVLVRGHNTNSRGDSKANLREIAAAIEGKTTSGLTVSPTSGQAAFDTVAPILAQAGAALERALAEPDTRDRLLRASVVAVWTPPAEYRRALQSARTYHADLLQSIGMKQE